MFRPSTWDEDASRLYPNISSDSSFHPFFHDLSWIRRKRWWGRIRKMKGGMVCYQFWWRNGMRSIVTRRMRRGLRGTKAKDETIKMQLVNWDKSEFDFPPDHLLLMSYSCSQFWTFNLISNSSSFRCLLFHVNPSQGVYLTKNLGEGSQMYQEERNNNHMREEKEKEEETAVF